MCSKAEWQSERVNERIRERERDPLSADSYPKCPQQPVLRQEGENSIQIFHVGGGDSASETIPCCLAGWLSSNQHSIRAGFPSCGLIHCVTMLALIFTTATTMVNASLLSHIQEIDGCSVLFFKSWELIFCKEYVRTWDKKVLVEGRVALGK